MTEYYVTPQQFGAAGDGVQDDTQAVRDALGAACAQKKPLFMPAGTYKTDCIALLPRVSVIAEPNWSYRGGSWVTFVPLREEQPYLFDLSNATGVTLRGIAFDGQEMGKNMHGLWMHRDNLNRDLGEHSIRIEDCQALHFSGDGAHFEGVWALSARGSQFCWNKGYGIYFDGTDGFFVDNWFSANGKAGFGSDTWNSAVNFTSNRVEWNRDCGLRLGGSMRYNITGNYFDRSYGPAIVIEAVQNYHKRLEKYHTVVPYGITITGNNIVRSGKDAEPNSDRDCHIYMKKAVGITVTANTFNVWKDDGRNGRISPWYGIITEECSHCVIANNTMLPGAVKGLFKDKGGHGKEMVIKDNVGEIVPEKAWNCQDPFTPIHFMSEGGAPWFSELLEGENND